MPRHYLSRKSRNAPVSIALCGYQFTDEELDWSRRKLPYSFIPGRVACRQCRQAIKQLVPEKHWSRPVEIHSQANGTADSYIAEYPDRMVKGSADSETTVFSPFETAANHAGPPEHPERPYLEYQNFYDIQKLLAKTASNPWRQPVHDLRLNAVGALEESIQRLKRTAVHEADPENRFRFRLAAEQLNHLRSEIKSRVKNGTAVMPSAENFQLDPEQVPAFRLAWEQLETLRRSKALSLYDVMVPTIEDAGREDC